MGMLNGEVVLHAVRDLQIRVDRSRYGDRRRSGSSRGREDAGQHDNWVVGWIIECWLTQNKRQAPLRKVSRNHVVEYAETAPQNGVVTPRTPREANARHDVVPVALDN